MALPTNLYQKLYAACPRRLSYQPHHQHNFTAWATQVRDKLAELLRLDWRDTTDVTAEIVNVEQCDGVRREKLLIRDAVFGDIPAYLLCPDGAEPRPGVLCLHGHGGYYAAKDMVAGVHETHPIANECSAALNYDYGMQLARAGYVTLCPDAFNFGERMLAADRWAESDVCPRYHLALAIYGLTPLGVTTAGNMRAIDYLLERQEVRGTGVGCVGLSYGGIQTMVLACIERRVTAAVISGALSSFEDALEDFGLFCGSQVLPGLLEWFDFPDIALAIAPRPVLYEMMQRDSCFAFTASWRIYQWLEEQYAALGVPDNIEADVVDTDHRYSGAKVPQFLARHLSM
jgi:dienelactone hydrolase